MIVLADKNCVPCRGGVPRLTRENIAPLSAQLPTWEVVDHHHLQRTFSFANFREALDFTNAVGELAERQGHHPDIHLAWGKVKIEIWTHKIDGLTESDFVLDAKIERLSA
jgi:4a-hydroxytetrahydrobiopterin dehydratase